MLRPCGLESHRISCITYHHIPLVTFFFWGGSCSEMCGSKLTDSSSAASWFVCFRFLDPFTLLGMSPGGVLLEDRSPTSTRVTVGSLVDSGFVVEGDER